MKPRLHPNDHQMLCIWCLKPLPMPELLLLWPKRKEQLAGKYDAWTAEPDFFCRPCAKELKIDRLPQHNQAKWLNQASNG